MTSTFACRCEHIHGLAPCEKEGCACPRFRRATPVKTPLGQTARAVGANLLYETPDLYLALYGLRNPMVGEAIRLGAIVDLEPVEANVYRDTGTQESGDLARRLGL